MRTQTDYERIYHALYRQCGSDINDFIVALAKSAVLRRGAVEEILDERVVPVLDENAPEKKSSPTHYTIIFDGGAKGNPGPSYGSYAIKIDDGNWLPPRRRDFGFGTNNEAEWKSLVEGLKELAYDVGFSNGDTLTITGDSQLVIKQLTGEWKIKEPRMRPLYDQATNLLNDAGRVEFVWRPREHSVAVLGH